MINYKAEIKNFKNYFVCLKVSDKAYNLNKNIKTLYIGKKRLNFGHYAILVDKFNGKKPQIILPNAKLKNGDIICVFDDGNVTILWDKNLNPHDFTLFITNVCNANCIMCPQPPKKDDFSYDEINFDLIRYLKQENITNIGITGGEPTIKFEILKKLIEKSHKNFPKAKISILTNGILLENFKKAKEIAILHPNLEFCISFDSDNFEDYAKIMSNKNFFAVLKAVRNLGILNQQIELRVVILKQNYKRLLQISQFIYRNFTFVTHITFMGVKFIGNAYKNFDKIYVEIEKFKENLSKAVEFLYQSGLNVSIYNIPLCVFDTKFHKFMRNSISPWKRNFETECEKCSLKSNCSGLFQTSQKQIYKIKAI